MNDECMFYSENNNNTLFGETFANCNFRSFHNNNKKKPKIVKLLTPQLEHL